ncbi:MBL fold metallo-hydrolase [Xylophilus ampelinus]|uniref:Glyoxylase-like metal-dependent hydrolase (Beta-lactamase superfamily II) n=1 Tax=Xylophilus ampelinus TaxID=54067 RepID=A0A318SFH6_9BURK|nr:MBL fold metallo-hydrolase [Xylophilus ampelinus]MCS4510748.1 MBL fold metallo-hydrolase [Xylophilus ampelinus]PYE76276.1 glyoxylase-like metal-dependent hydrolase (beta-lactamase superfamily II) [Xylophilus ampelinus]
MLQYRTLPVTAFHQNCSLLWDDATMQGVLIDPGGDVPLLIAAAEELGATLTQIWLTHAHIDHAGGVAELVARRGLPVIGPHPDDQFLIDGLAEQARAYGFPPAGVFLPQRWLQGGDTVALGEHVFQVRHCPGHSPGHVVFHNSEMNRAFVGDVLFAGSVGRTDFPRSDPQALIRSIVTQLWPLGDATVFVPGHGPESTFGRERRSNPYVGGT